MIKLFLVKIVLQNVIYCTRGLMGRLADTEHSKSGICEYILWFNYWVRKKYEVRYFGYILWVIFYSCKIYGCILVIKYSL